MRGLGEFVEEGFFELDEEVGAHGIPACADDVVAGVDSEVGHGFVAVEGFEAEVFIAVVFGPFGFGFEELFADAFAAEVTVDAGEPVVEDEGFEFEADGESDGAGVECGEHDEDVVAALEAAAEILFIFRWSEDRVVEFHDHGDLLFGDDADICLGHANLSGGE